VVYLNDHAVNYYKEIEMRILKLCILAVVAIFIVATAQFAQKKPNYDCGKVGRNCTAKCDEGADKTKNAKRYEKCLAGCEKSEADCNKREDTAGECAKSFQSCNKDAKSESDKNACRAACRKCKGE
jgi:hypothetical protein